MNAFRRVVPVFFLALLAVSILAAVYALMLARFAVGDTYAPYSSRRADPLGTRMLFEALAAMPGVDVERGATPFDPFSSPHTRLVAGASPTSPVGASLAQTLGWIAGGGRLILAFDGRDDGWRKQGVPEAGGAVGCPPPCCGEPDGAPPPESVPPGLAFGSEMVTFQGLLAALGCRAGTRDFPVDVAPSRARREASTVELPETIPWRSKTVFDFTDDDWTPVYRTHRGCGMAFRRLGNGEVVVMSESYALSNEALAGDRQTVLLAWLLAGRERVVFDDVHLGELHGEGVGGLVRRYRLQGVLLALGLAGLLFVWRDASPLVPVRHGEDPATTLPARASGDALVALLRRCVAPRRLPVEWCRAWERNHPGAAPDDRRRMQRAFALAENADAGNLPEIFERLAGVLARTDNDHGNDVKGENDA